MTTKFDASITRPFVCTVLCLSLLLCPVTGWGEEGRPDLPKDALKALYLAQKALEQDKYGEAAAILSEYTKAPETAIPSEVYLMLGHAQYQQGDRKHACATFQKGHESDPRNENLLLNYAVLTYESEQFKAAGRLFEKLYILKQKQDKKILFQSAVAYYQAGDPQKTKSLLVELVTDSTEPNEKWYELLINICVELEQWRDTEKWVAHFLKIKPAQATYWRLLAQLRLDRQEYREAAGALEIAYQLEPPKKNQWRELGDLYLYLGAPLMAARCLRLADGPNMSEKEHILIANAYARSRRYDAAVDYLDNVYGGNPNSAVLYEKGKLLYEAGRYKDALTVLRQSTRLNNREGRAYMLIGFIEWMFEEWESARIAFVDAAGLPEFHDRAMDAKQIMDDLIEMHLKEKIENTDAEVTHHPISPGEG